MWLTKIYFKTNWIIPLLLATLISHAQAPRKFYTKIGGNGYDYGYDVKQTLDNGYIITGSTTSFGQGNTDVYLLKLDSIGQIKFHKAIGNAANEVGKSIVQLADSSFVMVGYTNSIGFGGYDIYLIKTDKDGNELWHKTFGGADWDFAYSLQVTTDGGFIIGGTTYSIGRGAADGYVLKTDANGVEQWHKTYGGINDDEFKSVIQTNDGNYALTGYTKSYNDVDSGDVWVFKLDINGDSLWCKFYGGGKEDFGNEIIEHPNGNFFVAGASQSYGTGMLDGFGLKLDNLGNQIWYQTDGHSGTNEIFHSVVIPLGNPSLTAFAETDNLSFFGVQPKIFILNASSWYHNATGYGDTKEDEIFKIIRTKDYGFACIGYTKSFNAVLSDVFLIKTDSNLVGSQNIVGLQEMKGDFDDLSIYPNPCSDHLYIDGDLDKVREMNLFDILGNTINIDQLKSSIETNKLKLDFNQLSNGIYFLKINSKTQKIIIDR